MASSPTVVLVTGGNAGIGYEICKKLALEHPDTHHVLMGTRSLSKGSAAAKEMGSPKNLEPIQLDITDDSSIESCFQHISSQFGKLDILINNAGSAGRDLPEADEMDAWRERQSGADDGAKGAQSPEELKMLRNMFTHVYATNDTGAALLTERMVPLLFKSSLPKIIMISSGLGSIQDVLKGYPKPGGPPLPVPWYNSSKAAMNYLAAYYSQLYPKWKVNTCCPGLNATGLNGIPVSEELHPRNGAINAVKLALEGEDGVTGTYSNKEGPLPW
ncbi:hypothetical protein LTS18_008351 [Coniosporium uncinatum]|uniref:Uncharacterized protein n=1 Tax=Coniosporium uncinatum TaxID=93489 RepID=A0ACC3DNP4_9PEZI|nr:hypothetical protein LTS18_008351 [Coniosporium uncinatum]